MLCYDTLSFRVAPFYTFCSGWLACGSDVLHISDANICERLYLLFEPEPLYWTHCFSLYQSTTLIKTVGGLGWLGLGIGLGGQISLKDFYWIAVYVRVIFGLDLELELAAGIREDERVMTTDLYLWIWLNWGYKR